MLGYLDQLGELAKVLGCGCEVELVTGAAWPSEPQPVEPQNALEMSKMRLR